MEIDRNAPVCVEREIEIAAPIEVVWGVLTDLDDLPRWFSLGESVAIDGPLAPGATIRMKGRGTGTITATIEVADEPSTFGWTSRTFGLAVMSVWRLDRYEGGTRVEKGESMSGLPARLLRRPLQKKTVEFMETWLHDLKVEAEDRA
ncbi:MAG TPA: SRPBCC domain-containing protein [Gaiellaceae bacterium]|nr:SRPBCC domain-containing protein [Gaiellaceae bacterium]